MYKSRYYCKLIHTKRGCHVGDDTARSHCGWAAMSPSATQRLGRVGYTTTRAAIAIVRAIRWQPHIAPEVGRVTFDRRGTSIRPTPTTHCHLIVTGSINNRYYHMGRCWDVGYEGQKKPFVLILSNCFRRSDEIIRYSCTLYLKSSCPNHEPGFRCRIFTLFKYSRVSLMRICVRAMIIIIIHIRDSSLTRPQRRHNFAQTTCRWHSHIHIHIHIRTKKVNVRCFSGTVRFFITALPCARMHPICVRFVERDIYRFYQHTPTSLCACSL